MLELGAAYILGLLHFSIPKELAVTYLLFQLRYLFFSYLIVYFFAAPYTLLIFIIAILLADFSFYVGIANYVEAMEEMNDD